MSAGTYKPTHTHQSTSQAIKVWQARLRAIVLAMEKGADKEAQSRLDDLLQSIKVEAFPEFADNLAWLYRSAKAHLEADQRAEAAEIVKALHRLLEAAAQQLESSRSSRPPFTGSEGRAKA